MKRITYERNRRGWSQAELARRAGIHPTSMSRIENGKEPPYPHRAARLAAALGWDGEPLALFDDVGVS